MNPDDIIGIAGYGGLAILFWIVLLVGGFILSAWIMSLYVRLILKFSRKALDREYRYMRGDYYVSARTNRQ